MRRGPNAQILVSKPEDVTWDKPPTVDAAAMTVIDRLNVDFDDQAGQFNSGSVQTNRKLNETVGGMKLISGSANAVSEFDLRVWIETWVEPTIAQIVKCIQYYENDADHSRAVRREGQAVREVRHQRDQRRAPAGAGQGQDRRRYRQRRPGPEARQARQCADDHAASDAGGPARHQRADHRQDRGNLRRGVCARRLQGPRSLHHGERTGRRSRTTRAPAPRR
jgi:hypothetical protein